MAPRRPPPPPPPPRSRAPLSHQLDEFRKVILNVAFIGIVALLLFTAAKVLRSGDMVIEAIGLPKNIKELGYSEDGAALMLADNIRKIAVAANSQEAPFAVKANFEEQDISVPVEGLSFTSIIRLIRQTLGLPQNRLIGDFVCPTEPCLSSNLQLRMRLLQGVGAPLPLATVSGQSHDAILQTAAERFMENASPMALAIYLYDSDGRRPEAMALARQIAQTDSQDRLNALNLLGVELFDRPEKKPEDLREAISYYQQLLEEEPGFANAYTNWGAALSALGDKEGAVSKYRKAIELSPDDHMPHHNLGVVLAALGKSDEAAAAFERAITIDPAYADSYVGLGNVQLDQGKAAEALATFQKAGSLAPGSANVQYNIGAAARKAGQASDARRAFETYLQLAPDASDREQVQGFITELGTAN